MNILYLNSYKCGIIYRVKREHNMNNDNNYFVSKSGPSVMVDIDDTLVCWDTPEGCANMEIPIKCNGVTSYRVPNKYNINLLKKMYESGHVIILWSGSGVRWCRAVAKALDIEKYIHGCISKPTYYIDDISDPKEWMGKHGYFDFEGNRVHGSLRLKVGEKIGDKI